MKILTRTDFLDLPSGVLYSLCNEYCTILTDLFVKYESVQNIQYNPLINIDWIEANILRTPMVPTHTPAEEKKCLEDSLSSGTSFELDYNQKVRNNLYHEFQLFAVYEKKDVQKLIGFLNKTLSTYPMLEGGEEV